MAGNVLASVYLADDFRPGFLSMSRWVIGVAAFAPFVRRDFAGASALNLGLIAITVPIFVLGIDRSYFGERTTARQKVGFALVTLGIVGTVAKGDLRVLLTLSFGTADLWVLAAAAVFAVYSVVVSRGERHVPADVFQFASYLVGLAFVLPFAGYEFARAGWPVVNAAQGVALLYVGVGASLVAYRAWTRALTILGPTRAGILYNTLPIFSTALAYWLLGEDVSGAQAAAGGLVIAGVLVTVGE